VTPVILSGERRIGPIQVRQFDIGADPSLAAQDDNVTSFDTVLADRYHHSAESRPANQALFTSEHMAK
jgi:hypothetical protein